MSNDKLPPEKARDILEAQLPKLNYWQQQKKFEEDNYS